MTRRKLAAGNWKMNGRLADVAEIAALRQAVPAPGCDVLICPPATLIVPMVAAATGSGIRIGGQDCHSAMEGAYTGNTSAAHLADAGAVAVILGHSERRADHGESSALVASKTRAAWSAGLTAIVCVGETEAERADRRTLDVVRAQLMESVPDGAEPERTVLAYEPVWAIGSGRTPTEAEIVEVHRLLRASLTDRFGAGVAEGIRLLYGGSVKPGNAREIFALPEVDGGLVGGASLKAADLAAIIAAAS